ncbi:hypothetical protein OEZ85_011753 [Tetradesmus obliquus]|uniref:Nucleotide-diphospho-sugar transferase domain-containing protein n=1 Tax=Tetradesmus obliquus TaxID=3088 RepID=A0ABY8TR96_TETOB|nr:hypothetical protein OEZ85_011753 [Tetradesmus obliquus]
MVSYTNSGLMRWALNWAAICSSIKVKHLVIAFDRDAAAALQLNGILVHDASAAAAALPSSTRFRETPELFRLMGHIKVSTALQLQQQYQWHTMVLSDTDTAWLQHPALLLRFWPAADLLVSTDCLSAAAVAAQNVSVPRCQMMPGGWTSAWNTGIVVARNTPAAAAALQEWANRLGPAALSKTAEGWQIDDQLGFSNMIDEGSLPWTKHFAANFLTYQNLVTEYVAHVARVWQQHTGKPMALLHQHLLAAAFQLQVLAEALAAARVLGRVLVPPSTPGKNTCVLQ